MPNGKNLKKVIRFYSSLISSSIGATEWIYQNLGTTSCYIGGRQPKQFFVSHKFLIYWVFFSVFSIHNFSKLRLFTSRKTCETLVDQNFKNGFKLKVNCIREAAKLSGHIFWGFLELQKSNYFLVSGLALTPPHPS